MLDIKDITFNDDLEMYTSIDGIDTKAYIILSDGLDAAEEVLTEEYKVQIANFINSSTKWYDVAFVAIKDRAMTEYRVKDVQHNDTQLMKIYVLFEQGKKEIYGLLFRVSFDIEHGCGLKISGDDFQVLEIGEADVAFC